MKNLLKKNDGAYDWKFCSVGGMQRVQIASGEDIAHLGELDQKLWTVLSCPVKGLEFDARTLAMLDTDNDGKIRAVDVIAAARWLTSLVKDKDLILAGNNSMPLEEINVDTEEGQGLKLAAQHILSFLGKTQSEISLEDADEGCRRFLAEPFNGDGVITPGGAVDEDVKAVLEACIASGFVANDVSGATGVDEECIDKFYLALKNFAEWSAVPEANSAILPFGEKTAEAYALCNKLRGKIEDYFVRCRLIAFDESAKAPLCVSSERFAAISDKSLTFNSEEIAAYPLATPSAGQALPLDAINPVWKADFDKMCSIVLDSEMKGAKEMKEAQWKAILAKFTIYEEWLASKKGSEVEALGIDKVKALLACDKRVQIAELIASDKAVSGNVAAVNAVARLLHLYRDFYHFLNNYVIFSDFYSSDNSVRAIFECGNLYIDQRCCNLCIKVDDMGKQGNMSSQSGMFLLYCTCTSKIGEAPMDIVAVMTAGDVDGLRVGKNGIFYDRNGMDWDAVVTKVVDNPISIHQAFWSPYRKFANFVADKIDKGAAQKDAEAVESMKAKHNQVESDITAGVEPPAKESAFDIAKFAGIFAAIGMALGYIGAFFTSVFEGAFDYPLGVPITIAVLLLCISGPSCLMAAIKLHKRNLGPVLNANGWAINSVVLVNILFGNTLTSVASYPKLKVVDPYMKNRMAWWKWLLLIILALGVAVFVLYFTNSLAGCGLPYESSKCS